VIQGHACWRLASDCVRSSTGHPEHRETRRGTMNPVIHVCTTCRRKDLLEKDGQVPGGALLYDEVSRAARGKPGLRVQPYKCLSACDRPCTVALSSPGKFTYVFGGLDPLESAADIVRTAELFRDKPDGLMPRAERPPRLQPGIVARVPPMTLISRKE
jgi:predicted metal-binding protein